MKLSRLTGTSFDPDPDIAGLTSDSREVEPNFLFAAIKGGGYDGADFIDDAIDAGAVAILADMGVTSGLPVINDPEPRRRLSEISSTFFGAQPKTIAGITGTNGKTSTAFFCEQLWRRLGSNAASIGTLGVHLEEKLFSLQHTTPDPVMLHHALAELVTRDVTHVAMEVSSHGLAQYRADSVDFSIAGFTNITQDHLDFHNSFDDYFDAKKKLFTELLPADGIAVVNTDGAFADSLVSMLQASGIETITTGSCGDIKLASCLPHAGGLSLNIVPFGGAPIEVQLPLIGAFQAENALLAAGILVASGENPSIVIGELGSLDSVPGRMMYAGSIGGGSVYIDYAHTPDAINSAIEAIRLHATGRIIVVFGAGGDRDKSKRSLMGKAAQKADVIIVTDDNPRSEDPEAIRKEIMVGCPDASEIGDRSEAIAHGVSMMQSGDVLLVAGKGHEMSQIVGHETRYFSDAECVQDAISSLGSLSNV